jgi:hypothetical protein
VILPNHRYHCCCRSRWLQAQTKGEARGGWTPLTADCVYCSGGAGEPVPTKGSGTQSPNPKLLTELDRAVPLLATSKATGQPNSQTGRRRPWCQGAWDGVRARQCPTPHWPPRLPSATFHLPSSKWTCTSHSCVNKSAQLP